MLQFATCCLSINNLVVLASTLLILFIFYKITKPNKYVLFAENQHREKEGSAGDWPPFYPNGWLPVIESRDVSVGAVKHVKAFGQSLAVFRGISGRVHVWDAYCPHLGANLGFGGTVVGDGVRCPFHGWIFDETGLCVEIPGCENNNIPKASIKTWQSLDINGVIMVWHHSDDKEPQWWPQKIDFIERGDVSVRSSLACTANMHIQDVAENGADANHLKNLHNHTDYVTNLNLPFKSVLRKLPIGIELDWQVDWKVDSDDHNVAQTDARAILTMFNLIKWEFTLLVRQLGPAQSHILVNLWLTKRMHVDLNVVANVFTEGPLYQRILFCTYTKSNWLSIIVYKIFFWTEYFLVSLINDDFMVWNDKIFVAKPIVVKGEDSIVGFRRYYKQFYR